MTEKKEQILGGVVAGFDAFILARQAREKGLIVHISDSDAHLNALNGLLAVVAPDVRILAFPAWDTIPYDRVSPNLSIESERLDTLSTLANGTPDGATIILTCVSAVLQKVPPIEFFKGKSLSFKVGDLFDIEQLKNFLQQNGYLRTEQVIKSGEYALRGGIIDIFATGTEQGYRLDLFGDVLESIRLFDPTTQKTIGVIQNFSIKPMAEFILNEKTISHFRTDYRTLAGEQISGDLLYESVSAGRKVNGLEHWLPLFFDEMASFFDYLPADTSLYLDENLSKSVLSRQSQIFEYYQARLSALKNKDKLDIELLFGLRYYHFEETNNGMDG